MENLVVELRFPCVDCSVVANCEDELVTEEEKSTTFIQSQPVSCCFSNYLLWYGTGL